MTGLRTALLTNRPLAIGLAAITALALAQWLLIALATVGAFVLWWVALPFLLLAIGGAGVVLYAIPPIDRVAVLLLVVLAFFLYLPPAEELALTGDAAIYLNEGFFVAHNGALHAVHEPLAALPPETRTLFYVTAAEQFPARPMRSYEGILYRSYYMADAASATIETSRMPLVTVWFAFVYALAGVKVALYSAPLFALLSLLLFYAVARHLFRWPQALAVVLLLAVSYPQIYFGRISYAEIFGQFWTLAGILAALAWLEWRSPALLLLAFLFWATTWAGRIDALLLLPAAYLLLIDAGLARDRRTLLAVGVTLPLLAALVYLGTNGAYAGATFEIQQWRWPWFGKALLALLLLAPISTAVAWVGGDRLLRVLTRMWPLLRVVAFGALAFVLLWATLPNPLRSADVTRPYQEIIWYSSAYLTPLFYWLVLIGVGRLLFGRLNATRFWLLALFYSLATVFFYTYTSARVYPVSLRRLTSDLIPIMMLLVGAALAPTTPTGKASAIVQRIGRQAAQLWVWGRWAAALILLGWLGWLSRPLLAINEGVNTAAFLAELHEAVPADAVLIFEDQDSDSWVGWLAAPVYSRYGQWSLLLDGDNPDPDLWQQAVTALTDTGRPLYVVTQQAEYPAALLPSGYMATLKAELPWQSTLIGQASVPPYPPPIWDFLHPLHLYQLTPDNTAQRAATRQDHFAQATPLTLSAPNGKLQAEFFVNDLKGGNAAATQDSAKLYYRVTYGDRQISDLSAIGLTLAPSTEPLQQLAIVGHSLRTFTQTYTTTLGQNTRVDAVFNELEIGLREDSPPKRDVTLHVRLYDSALALRQMVGVATTIAYDRVDFALQPTDVAYYQAGTEGAYQALPVAQLPTVTAGTPSETPLTVALANGLFVSIMEAEVVNYPRALLARRTDQAATLSIVPAVADDISAARASSLPTQTPWRVLLVTESAAALAAHGDLLAMLNPPTVLADESWIRPGSAMRVMKLNTAAARAVIDFAAAHGIDYVELDAGWYGLGYHEEANPASDATHVVAELDMPQILQHARERGVGVWLYVNAVALQQQLDELLPRYASWGIAGIKLGFVDGRSRAGINFVHEVVRRAAAYHLMVDVHDNYRPSGGSRTYPNLLTQEGVRGNEYFPDAEQQMLLPFTRLLAGAADTTFAYYSGDLKVTRAQQLAAQIVYFSPLRFVLWYDSPVHYQGEAEVDFMGALPTVWDETRVLHGAIGDFITVARRKGTDWFVGIMTDKTARTAVLALDFLEPNRSYRARIYRDRTPTAVAIEEETVTAASELTVTLLSSGGQALWLTPLAAE